MFGCPLILQLFQSGNSVFKHTWYSVTEKGL